MEYQKIVNLIDCEASSEPSKFKTKNWVEILQLGAKFQTAMVSCSRFIWITNSSDHRRVCTANLLHTKSLPNLLGHKA